MSRRSDLLPDLNTLLQEAMDASELASDLQTQLAAGKTLDPPDLADLLGWLCGQLVNDVKRLRDTWQE